ncbi:hypothetical protein ACOSQ2_027200 [Xanthoceras sorbifolium]
MDSANSRLNFSSPNEPSFSDFNEWQALNKKHRKRRTKYRSVNHLFNCENHNKQKYVQLPEYEFGCIPKRPRTSKFGGGEKAVPYLIVSKVPLKFSIKFRRSSMRDADLGSLSRSGDNKKWKIWKGPIKNEDEVEEVTSERSSNGKRWKPRKGVTKNEEEVEQNEEGLESKRMTNLGNIGRQDESVSPYSTKKESSTLGLKHANSSASEAPSSISCDKIANGSKISADNINFVKEEELGFRHSISSAFKPYHKAN